MDEVSGADDSKGEGEEQSCKGSKSHRGGGTGGGGDGWPELRSGAPHLCV